MIIFPVMREEHEFDPDLPSTHYFPQQAAKPRFWSKIGGGALSFAVLFHIILLLLGAMWIFQWQTVKVVETPGTTTIKPGDGKKSSGNHQTTTKTRVPAPAPAGRVSIPVPAKISIMDSNKAMGGAPTGADGLGDSPGQIGSSMGPGIGKGPGGEGFLTGNNPIGPKMFDLLPQDIGKRCSKSDRLQRLKENGGNEQCEDAVVKALQWLKGRQNPDGSWGTANKPAMTGLVLLAYFGHCETTESTEFGDSCKMGIAYLINLNMQGNGTMKSTEANPFPYEHAIATYALAEAATFCKSMKVDFPGLPDACQKAGQYIIDHQHANGGWAYAYSTASNAHTDTSIVGWQLQALRACSHTGIKFEGMESTVNKGLKYLASNQNANGGYGYNSPAARGSFYSLTGVGVLCHQMWDKGNTSDVRKGVKYIKESAQFKWDEESSDLYAHYYMSQAMMQAGGTNWSHYNEMFRNQLLQNQNADGSWKKPAGKSPGSGNEIYQNALCTLMLEVYYRFLNAGGHGINRNRDF